MSAPVRSLPGAAVRRVREALEAGGFGPARGSSWRCPAHEDRSPSLSVDEGEGRALVKCFAGCSAEAVAGALGLAMADLFDDRREGPRSARRAAPMRAKAPRVVKHEPPRPWTHAEADETAVHPYFDGDALAFEVVRFSTEARGRGLPKCKPRYRGTDGRLYFGLGPWKGREDAPLYREREALEELRQGGTVYVTEGEKDADAIAAAGGVACCNVGGADKLHDAHAARLAKAMAEGAPHARVVVVQDRDAPGEKHAADVLGKLRRAGAPAECLRLALPALEHEHADAADHLEAGHSLAELVESEPPASMKEPAGETVSLLHARFTLEAMRIDGWFDESGAILPAPARRYLVKDFLPERETGLLVARGGTGKGFLELYLATSLALGESFGRFDVESPRGVVIVSREDDREELHRRFEATMCARFPDGATREHVRRLREHLRVVDLRGVRDGRLGPELCARIVDATRTLDAPGLVILDPLGKLLPEEVVSLNSQEGAALIHQELDVLGLDSGCAVLLAHHVNKAAVRDGASAGASTGSQLLEDLARFVVALNEVKGEDAKGYGLDPEHRLGFVALTVTKANYAPPLRDPFVLERVEGGALLPRAVRPPSELRAEAVLRVLVEAFEASGEGLSQAAWEKACTALKPPVKRDPCRTARAELKTRGLVVSQSQKVETPGKRGPAPLVFVPTRDALARFGGQGNAGEEW